MLVSTRALSRDFGLRAPGSGFRAYLTQEPVVHVLSRVHPIPDVVPHVGLDAETNAVSELLEAIQSRIEVPKRDGPISTAGETPDWNLRGGDGGSVLGVRIAHDRQERRESVRMPRRQVPAAKAA